MENGIEIHIDVTAPERNLRRAQQALLFQMTADMQPFVPFQLGGLRRSVRYPKGITGDEIEYHEPYAHYMYEGEIYGPNYRGVDKNGDVFWWSPDEKFPTGRQMEYHTPGTGDHWFDKAAEKHLKDWEELVERRLIMG